MRIVAVLLILAGLLALLLGGVSVTRRREVARVGPISASVRERETLAIPRLVGGALLVGGLVLLGATARRRRS